MLNYILIILQAPFTIKKDVFSFYLNKVFFRTSNPSQVYTKRVVRCISNLGSRSIVKHGNSLQFAFPYKGQELKLYIRDESTSDFGIVKEIFLKDEYSLLFDHTTHLKKEQSITIIDAGGNIGLFTCLCKIHWPTSTVFMIEPDPLSSEIAKQTTEANHFHGVVPIRAALWNRNTFLRIVNIDNHEGNASFRVEETNDSNDIKGITLKDLIEMSPKGYVDILKIDIEGAEKNIFNKEHFTEDIASKIGTIIIEIHDQLCDKQEIIRIINSQNFKLVANSPNVYLFSSL